MLIINSTIFNDTVLSIPRPLQQAIQDSHTISDKSTIDRYVRPRNIFANKERLSSTEKIISVSYIYEKNKKENNNKENTYVK